MSTSDRAFVDSFAPAERRIDGKRVKIAVGENVTLSIDFRTHSIKVMAPPGVSVSVEPDDQTQKSLNPRRAEK